MPNTPQQLGRTLIPTPDEPEQNAELAHYKMNRRQRLADQVDRLFAWHQLAHAGFSVPNSSYMRTKRATRGGRR